MTTYEQQGSSGFYAASFGAHHESSASVASLDSPLVQQTKSEIRSLAAEIAELAHSAVTPEEFYDGFLPRLCVAMGASGGAIWDCRSGGNYRLLASQSLPDILVNELRPSEPHDKILRCAVAEGQPILVPASSTTVEADRPSNPLSEALIIIPVRIESDVEYTLEIVHRPSGGPAAQRGYLRFVAQMGDLLADYLRRQQLRELAARAHRLNRIEDCLVELASTPAVNARMQIAAEALAELLDADQCIVLAGNLRPNVRSISYATKLDPRSEVVQASIAFAKLTQNLDSLEPQWFRASDRRAADGIAPSGKLNGDGTEDLDTPTAMRPTQQAVDQLCELLRCRRLMRVSLNAKGELFATLAFADSCPSPEQLAPTWTHTTVRLTRSVGTLLETQHSRLGKLFSILPLMPQNTAQLKSNYEIVQAWILRCALVCLLIAISLFPVPQQIAATATLQPITKQVYYAPMQSVVSEVLIDEGDTVAVDQELIRLSSFELEREITAIASKLRLLNENYTDFNSRLSKDGLTNQERNDLEWRSKEIEIGIKTYAAQVEALTQQRDKLVIRATQSGTVASWDLKNRLEDRPLLPGEVLATTYQTDGLWKLQIAVPDYRAGLVAQAIDAATVQSPSDESKIAESKITGARVRFSLSSHPDQLHHAILTKLATQALPTGASHNPDEQRIIFGEAVLDGNDLPLKKEGAIARATIDCGKVPAIWLVFRDAYCAVAARIKMIW